MDSNALHQYTNALIQESSPYLLQHAHNPVNWYPWSDLALEKAAQENKLILVSIGYAACHWCHVMEHESFENEEVAQLMNAHFVCIKVDREERPDIDQVYMKAVQLMTRRGGWPLNCITLPDGRPIYGGTYFTKNQWIDVLQKVSDFYQADPITANTYADELTDGVKQSEYLGLNTEPKSFTAEAIEHFVNDWKKSFDHLDGGMNYAPKFPLPNNYLFLLHFYHASKDAAVFSFLQHTLHKMAYGGIYDQLGGGFSRYSTDMKWKVPHFEKMLYDNAQLVSLYSDAYKHTHQEEYRKIVYGTLAFIERELTSDEGGFYSSLDADSEGKEGKFYIWEKEELEALLGKESRVFFEYFNVNTLGFWEDNQYILLRNKTDIECAAFLDITEEELHEKISAAKKILFEAREKRIRPALDDKQLCSWNALMLKGYADAYMAFQDTAFLEKALRNVSFIEKNFLCEDGSLYHNYKAGRSNISGFLEDYAFLIDAYLSLYQASFQEVWLQKAERLTAYVEMHFKDPESGMYFFTSDTDPPLIARKMEIMDNVIPASNSQMALNLFTLGHLLGNEAYLSQSETMLNNVVREMPRYLSAHSNWGILFLKYAYPFYEIAISGEKASAFREEMNKKWMPNTLLAGAESESTLPILKNRYAPLKTRMYICRDKTCKLPVESIDEALQQMK